MREAAIAWFLDAVAGRETISRSCAWTTRR